MKGIITFFGFGLLPLLGNSQDLDTLSVGMQYKGGVWGFIQELNKSFNELDTSLVPKTNSPCLFDLMITIDTNGNIDNLDFYTTKSTCNDYLQASMFRAVENAKEGFKPYIKEGKQVPYVVFQNYRYQYWR